MKRLRLYAYLVVIPAIILGYFLTMRGYHVLPEIEQASLASSATIYSYVTIAIIGLSCFAIFMEVFTSSVDKYEKEHPKEVKE